MTTESDWPYPISAIVGPSEAEFSLTLERVEAGEIVHPPSARAEELGEPLANLLDALVGVLAYTEQIGQSADDLGAAIARNESAGADVADVERRLSALLRSRYVRIRAKIRLLHIEPPPALRSVRVVSELRPVLDEEPGRVDEVIGLIRTHQITIRTDSPDSDDKVITLAVSEQSLAALVESGQRVLTSKVEQLKGVVSASGLPDLTLPGGPQ